MSSLPNTLAKSRSLSLCILCIKVCPFFFQEFCNLQLPLHSCPCHFKFSSFDFQISTSFSQSFQNRQISLLAAMKAGVNPFSDWVSTFAPFLMRKIATSVWPSRIAIDREETWFSP
eukprot:GFUD01018430.1.p2 GENE.GFUD01018430.1~~GFUD01018430.1.p2  ORF type:complete len:116 (-),score=18.76 GFUD01018430.1:1373-1720(-)